MSIDNSVVLIGNVTNEPETRILDDKEGTTLVSFSLAHSTRRQNDKGEWEDANTSFIRCTAWRALAERIGETITKGMRVIVIGTMRQHSWVTDEGDKRSAVELTVDDCGPSLKWANATVTKVKGQGNGNGSARAENAPDEALTPPTTGQKY